MFIIAYLVYALLQAAIVVKISDEDYDWEMGVVYAALAPVISLVMIVEFSAWLWRYFREAASDYYPYEKVTKK